MPLNNTKYKKIALSSSNLATSTTQLNNRDALYRVYSQAIINNGSLPFILPFPLENIKPNISTNEKEEIEKKLLNLATN